MTREIVDTTTTRPDTVPPPRRAPEPTADLLQMQLHYPSRDSAVLRLRGAIDAGNTTRLYELVQPRLASQLHQLTLELSQLEFLSVSGARALAQLALLAHARQWRTTLRMANPTRAVRRALHATGLAGQLPTPEDLPDPDGAGTADSASHRAHELARQGLTSNH